MIQPANEQEVHQALDYCTNKNEHSSYIRLVSIPSEIPYSFPKDYRLVKGQGTTLIEGNDVIIFSYGPTMLTEAYKASDILLNKDIHVKLINFPWLNYIDSEWLENQVSRFSKVVTVDDHYVTGGQGDTILSAITTLDLNTPIQGLKIGVESIPECGTNEEVLEAHRLDYKSLAKRIELFVNSN